MVTEGKGDREGEGEEKKRRFERFLYGFFNLKEDRNEAGQDHSGDCCSSSNKFYATCEGDCNSMLISFTALFFINYSTG